MKLFFYIILLYYVLVWRQSQSQEDNEFHEGNVVVEDNLVYTTNENQPEATESFKQDNIQQLSAVDSIELVDLPEESKPTFRVKINYSVAAARILLIDVYAVADEYSKVIYHTEWGETAEIHDNIKVKVMKVNLPDGLVYKEDKTRNIRADLHSNYLLVRASMVDYHNPIVLLQYTEQSMKLTPPWRRMEKKGYSCSWKGMIVRKFNSNKIPMCPKIDDVIDLLPSTVALARSEHGFKKFFENINLPDDEFLDTYESVSPQFTLMTWLYLTKPCTNKMCPLIYRIKGTTYLTPLVGLLEFGYIHVQVHHESNFAYAFLFDAQMPVHKWVHLAITFKGPVVTLLIRHGRNLQNTKVFVHSEFPHGMYHYDDIEGYWASGGSFGFVAPHGFIGPARIYRRRALSVDTIGKTVTMKSKPNLAILNYFKNCRKLKSEVKSLLKSKMQSCERNVLPQMSNKNLNCPLGMSGVASEIVKVSELWSSETTDEIPNNIYNYAFNMIKTDQSKVKDALNFLSYSACLGHKPSMYLKSVLYGTGFGIPRSIPDFHRSLLIGAYYEHPLSQMALAYKYLIGVDGFPKDLDIAQVYYRLAGDTTNGFLNEHNEVDVHAEAVSLDKKEDLVNYRGPDSDWFTWLKHLAKQGVSDAHSALGEVFYYGARGFKRNLTKAAEYYELGANQGDAQMLFNLGVVKLRGQGVTKNEEEARELLNKAAELGFAPAFNALGYYELNVRENKSGALHYFNHAADNGDRDGLFNMGYAYENALAPDSTPNLELAVPYYINAANEGHPGGCICAGDAFSSGDYVERNAHLALIYYKYVADQVPEIGFHLRNGLDEYFAGNWYRSLLYYLLAAEAGLEVAQYNVGTLCEWDLEGLKKYTKVDCMWRYYNHSALLEWVPSMIKTGDNFWYGLTINRNITAATELYSKAATKDENPQAIYNLGYLVENNYSLDGLDWLHFHPSNFNQGNLSLAAILYRKCCDSNEDALLPCSIGLLRVAIKIGWQFQMANSEVLLIPTIIFLVIFGILVCICRISGSQNEIIDIA